MKYHSCNHIGSQLGDLEIRFDWRLFRFIASKKIESVFGCEVEGQLVGIGWTPRRAIIALHKSEHDHYESLWI